MKRNEAQGATFAKMYGTKNILRSLWYAYRFYRECGFNMLHSMKLAIYDVSFRW